MVEITTVDELSGRYSPVLSALKKPNDLWMGAQKQI